MLAHEAIDPVKELVDFLAGHGILLPRWTITVLVVVVALGIAYAAIAKAIGPPLGLIRQTLTSFRGWRRRRSRAARQRARFASHLESQLRRLGEKEEWRDDYFTSLAHLAYQPRPSPTDHVYPPRGASA